MGHDDDSAPRRPHRPFLRELGRLVRDLALLVGTVVLVWLALCGLSIIFQEGFIPS